MRQYAMCNFSRKIGAYTDMRTTAKAEMISGIDPFEIDFIGAGKDIVIPIGRSVEQPDHAALGYLNASQLSVSRCHSEHPLHWWLQAQYFLGKRTNCFR